MCRHKIYINQQISILQITDYSYLINREERPWRDKERKGDDIVVKGYEILERDGGVLEKRAR